MEKTIQEMRTRLHWQNRKTYSLVIPPAFFQATFNIFPRTNQACVIRPTQTGTGKLALLVEFE